MGIWRSIPRADSRLAPNQWETALQSNAVSHWLGTNLESALYSTYAGFSQYQVRRNKFDAGQPVYFNGESQRLHGCRHGLFVFPFEQQLLTIGASQVNHLSLEIQVEK